MSYHMSSVWKTETIRRPTDGTQNYKNVAQAEAALSNAQVNREKLKLAQLAAQDKHDLNKVKFARESIKLEQEAKEYWNNLSEEDRKKLVGQFYIENQAELQAYQNEIEDKRKTSETSHKWQEFRLKVAKFRQIAWRVTCITIGLVFGLPIAIVILIQMIKAIIYFASGGM